MAGKQSASAPAQGSSSWYSKEALLAARTPIGFVMHIGANLLMRHYPIVLQIPCIALIWWELAKEFRQNQMLVQFTLTALSLLDLFLLKSYPAFPIWQFAAARMVVIAVVLALNGTQKIDSIFLNYQLIGLTAVLELFERYPVEVMLTISMSIAGSDCFQFFSGKVAGRTKIVPTISPNKSLEGYIFAVISCLAIYYFYLADIKLVPIETGVFYVTGMLLCGIIGDLFQSWWKRNHRIKDSSDLLGAHGGFLDRLDSHLAAWLWSVAFVHFFYGTERFNFTGMDYDKIFNLIIVTWSILWAHWFGKRLFGLKW